MNSKIKPALGVAFLFLAIWTVNCSQNRGSPVEDSSEHTAQNQNQLEAEQDSIIRGQSLRADDRLSRSVVGLISERSEGQALCTGTILSSDIILTAAHCVDGQPRRISVIFGLKVKSAGKESIRAADAYAQNARWLRPTVKGRGDLALVHFQGGLPQGFSVVTLAKPSVDLSPGTLIKMIGYGVTNGTTETGSGTLRIAQSTILSKHSATEIVTDGKKSSVCFGDSGGPAFIQGKTQNGHQSFVQWGVASSVLSHACNEASIHTSVMSYSRWITATSQKLRSTLSRTNANLRVDQSEEVPVALVLDDLDDNETPLFQDEMEVYSTNL